VAYIFDTRVRFIFYFFGQKTNNTRAVKSTESCIQLVVYPSRMNTGCMRRIIKPEKEQKDKERVGLFMGMCTMQWQFSLAFTSHLSRHLLTCGRYLLLPSPLRVPSSFLLLIFSMFITMASARGTGLQIKEKFAEFKNVYDM
jgi:hypothetical protein